MLEPADRLVLDQLRASVWEEMSAVDFEEIVEGVAKAGSIRDTTGLCRVLITKAVGDLAKGDFPGHPFRGNQWTTADGASRGGASGASGGIAGGGAGSSSGKRMPGPPKDKNSREVLDVGRLEMIRQAEIIIPADRSKTGKDEVVTTVQILHDEKRGFKAPEPGVRDMTLVYTDKNGRTGNLKVAIDDTFENAEKGAVYWGWNGDGPFGFDSGVWGGEIAGGPSGAASAAVQDGGDSRSASRGNRNVAIDDIDLVTDLTSNARRQVKQARQRAEAATYRNSDASEADARPERERLRRAEVVEGKATRALDKVDSAMTTAARLVRELGSRDPATSSEARAGLERFVRQTLPAVQREAAAASRSGSRGGSSRAGSEATWFVAGVGSQLDRLGQSLLMLLEE